MFTIDRFEGDLAVILLDDGRFFNLPIALLPEGAEAGDVIRLCIDREAREQRQHRIASLMEDLFEN